jgi:hypothetical protein
MFKDSEDDLERAVQIAEEVGEPEKLVEARILLLRARAAALRSGEKSREASIAELFAQLSDSDLERYPDVAREVAGLVGSNVPQVLIRGLDTGGVGTVDETQRRQIASAIERVGDDDMKREFAGEQTRVLGLRLSSDRTNWQDIVDAADRAGTLSYIVHRVAITHAADDRLREDIAAVLRAPRPVQVAV